MPDPGRRTMFWRERITLLELTLAAGFLLFPLIASDYATTFATRVVILCLLALSFDLVWGYAGIMSFGQALFFGVGGYVTALIARDLGISSAALVLPIGALGGAGAALIVGTFLLLGRSSATMIFVALGTLITSYAAERGLSGWNYVGGLNGIPSFPAITIGSIELYEGTGFYLLSLATLALAYLAVRYITRSQMGLVLVALREDEARISFLGYRTPVLRLLVFAIGAAVAGIAGKLSAFHDGFVAPTTAGVILSTQAVVYVLLGGVGTRIGAIAGVLIVETMRFNLPQESLIYWPVGLGVVLLLVVVSRPAGLISLLVSDSEIAGRFGGRLRKAS